MGFCSECGVSKGETPSFIETQLRRQRARSYSSASEWRDLGLILALLTPTSYY
jgi:hypothetical protein